MAEAPQERSKIVASLLSSALQAGQITVVKGTTAPTEQAAQIAAAFIALWKAVKQAEVS